MTPEQKHGPKFTYPRPSDRGDGIPSRASVQHWSSAEIAINAAMREVEASGGSPALTEAINLLLQAKDRVADHMEGITWKP